MLLILDNYYVAFSAVKQTATLREHMPKFIKISVLFILLSAIAACTTVATNSIKESSDNQAMRKCKSLGDVNGSDAIFVGLSASVGSKNAYAKAMNQAVQMGATDLVWSQKGTSMTNEWIGKAYLCR